MATSLSSQVTTILNASLQAVDSVIPGAFRAGSPTVVTAPIHPSEVGVLVGITGEVKGRLFVSSTLSVFSEIGRIMYGMDLNEDMVRSFASEFTNMLAGNMVRLAEGMTLDISPPTTIEGGTAMYGFARAITVPLIAESEASVQLALMLEEL